MRPKAEIPSCQFGLSFICRPMFRTIGRVGMTVEFQRRFGIRPNILSLLALLEVCRA